MLTGVHDPLGEDVTDADRDGLLGEPLNSSLAPVRPIRSSLATIVPASAAPYGYTLTIWTSGAVLLRSHGTPGFADLLIFVAGAIAGFNLVAVLALAVTRNVQPIDSRRDRVLAGLLDWIAVGAVVGAVSAISAIHGWVPWLLGPLTATILYLVVSSLQLAALAARRNPDRGG